VRLPRVGDFQTFYAFNVGAQFVLLERQAPQNPVNQGNRLGMPTIFR